METDIPSGSADMETGISSTAMEMTVPSTAMLMTDPSTSMEMTVPSTSMEMTVPSTAMETSNVPSADKDACTDPHHLQSLTSSATTGKSWDFLKTALESHQASVVSLLEKNTVNLSAFIEHLCVGEEDHLCLLKLCTLVIEVGMLDTLKEIIVCVYQFDSCTESDVMTYEILYKIYERIVRVCSRDKMSEVLEAVKKDPRYCCQYLSVFLAVRLKKWKLALEIMRTQHVTLLRGSDKVFAQAVFCKAWACAVQVLHNALLVRNINDTEVLLKIELRVAHRLFSAKGYTDVLKPFVRQSKRGKMYAAGAVFAAWGKRWGLVHGLLMHLHRGPHNNTNIVLLYELMQNRKFQMVYSWLYRLSQQGPLQQDYVDLVLWEAGVNCRLGHASALVDWLMDKCEDNNLLTQVLYHIILRCQPDLLRKFIAKDLLQQCEELDFAFQCALDMYMPITSRNNNGTIVSTDIQNCRYQIIVMCIEAGLSCQVNDISHTLYKNTVEYGLNEPLVQLLHHTGFINFTDLHHMLLRMDMESCSLEERDQEEIRGFLKSLTDTPRTLKNLCCIRLSGIIGCGAFRKERALALGLPLKLTNQVLFRDVLYSESDKQAAMSGRQ